MLQLNIFDTVAGLPVHALIVHFAVVLLPLASLALIAEVIRPAWRQRYGLITVVVLTVGVGAAVISRLSGEQLATHLGRPVTHATWGTITTAVSIALWLASIIYVRLTRIPDGQPADRPRAGVAGVATVVLALATLGAVTVTGHSGAEAAWGGRVVETTPPSATATTAPGNSASPAQTTYTMADVATHNSASSCWAAIEGTVYDLTNWINRHPGGSQHILALCGTDGTSTFEGQHSGDRRPASELANYKIGTLS
ncbi:cytochrome b5 domain-containing protein [Propionibacterium sp.]|uniref:cytochrome b5 domain-containing protein n=1 Tax=Propionibacterium sp. TaxID=1977903 RepID=UPI0039EC98B0